MDKVAEVYQCRVEVVDRGSVRMTAKRIVPETPDVPDQVVTLDRADVDVYGNVELGEILYWVLGVEYGDNGIKDRFSKFKRPEPKSDIDYEAIFKEARETVEDLMEAFDDPSS